MSESSLTPTVRPGSAKENGGVISAATPGAREPPVTAGAGEGGLAAVGKPDAAGGERFEEGVSPRHVVHFILPGDDEPGRPGVVGVLEGVRLRLAGLLSSQLDRPGQPALEGRLIGFGDTDCQGIGHGGNRSFSGGVGANGRRGQVEVGTVLLRPRRRIPTGR